MIRRTGFLAYTGEPMKPEQRAFCVEGVEYRSDDDKQEYVDGLGVIYDRKTELWDGYSETIARGCFDKWLKGNPEIKSMIDHDTARILSTTRSNPRLVLEDTPDGIVYHSPIPNTTYGRDLVENLKRKNIRGSSFTFIVERDGSKYETDEKGNVHRIITRARLYEIGCVCDPAYTATKAGLRSKEEIMAEARSALAAATAETRDVENVAEEAEAAAEVAEALAAEQTQEQETTPAPPPAEMKAAAPADVSADAERTITINKNVLKLKQRKLKLLTGGM